MKRWATTAAVLLLGCGRPAAGQMLPAAEFRDRLAAAVAETTKHPTVVVDERSFRGKGADGEEMTFFIDNAYADYAADPSKLDTIVRRFATAVPAKDDALGTIEQLVVVVRPNDYLTRSVPAGASLDQFISPRPMAGDLSFYLAVDSPKTIRTAGKADLKRWGVSEADAWTRATTNIKARMGPLTPIRLSDENGVSGFGAESGLAPSVLADPATCGPANPDGFGEQTVLVVGRDAFLYAPTNDRAAAELFWKTVRDEVAADRSLSRTPLICRGGKWVVATKP